LWRFYSSQFKLKKMTTRRTFLQNTAIASAVAMAQPSFGFNILSKKPQPLADTIIGHNGYTYKVDKGWAKISINSNPLFNCHEMVQDSKGRLIMIGDNVHNNIMIFDKSGTLLDYWGTAFPGGHGLTLSKEGGEDFLILVDCGYFQDKTGKWQAQAGQVVKTDLTGKVIFTIGHPRTIGIYKDNEKFQPTETAVAPNGDIYVADGYGSDYIIQYNSKGQYIRHFGGKNNANKEHNLMNAHGVAVDTRDKNNPILICTSRDEMCFKVFTLDGKFIKRIDLPGMYVCRPVINADNLYAGVCWSKDKEGKRNANTGFVTILDKENKVISSPGGETPQYLNGILQPTLQMANPVFNHGHDVCIDEDKSIYVCQWNANQTPPVKLTRV
jgi:hypothetical protein